ncbi:hypothetical protein NADFUDRAFT_82558 [Nadsonia fulvescens var. elongata DSM 6958]|uniref:Iron-sulfur assembly protein 1 n=1 Tax=Nadsonia fulvescens var. elongata DSM 6958 TaxID=857566 RepID=A0A1E3PN74_9ASCO|nr:hypothetical protein NADFUDRAFT_82558 [Nadsonia fulvescens var. elongata DSM 6958]
MLRIQINRTFTQTLAAKRFLQTATMSSSPTPLPMASTSNPSDKWAKHPLPRMNSGIVNSSKTAPSSKPSPMMAGARMKKLSFGRAFKPNNDIPTQSSAPAPAVIPTKPSPSTTASTPISGPVTPMKSKRKLRPRKAVITLSDNAMLHLRRLLDSPNPQMIRVSVQNRGCSGLTYHLDYVTAPQKFDEQVIQDGICVLVDSKALFSIIGSKMDWVDDKLSSRFVFINPNSKGECGCGESFMV